MRSRTELVQERYRQYIINVSVAIRQHTNHIWSIDFVPFRLRRQLLWPLVCVFMLQCKHKLSYFCRHGFFAWNLSSIFCVFDWIFWFWGILFFQMQLKWKNVDFLFILFLHIHRYLANVNRCDLPQLRMCACVPFCMDVAVSDVVVTWKQGTQMNWTNAKCGFCFCFIALEFLHYSFRLCSWQSPRMTSFACVLPSFNARDSCVCHLTKWRFSSSRISLISVTDWFFCSILQNSWHTLPPPTFSYFGHSHVSALCSQTHRPLHITVVPLENGCKIPRKPKIWKRWKELIKLQRIERSAKLRMSCRWRPTDSLSLDKSMNFCMSGNSRYFFHSLHFGSNLGMG